MYEPVLNSWVAFFAAIIQGRPYSLATTAPWLISPPNSVTTPLNKVKYGDQAISVACVIKMSPLWILYASEKSVITHALLSTEPPHIVTPWIFIEPSVANNLSTFVSSYNIALLFVEFYTADKIHYLSTEINMKVYLNWNWHASAKFWIAKLFQVMIYFLSTESSNKIRKYVSILHKTMEFN